MTVATKFRSWQVGYQPGAPFTSCSPNLAALRRYAIDRWNLAPLGCYGVRAIRGGTSWSSHAFGAAVDLGYTDRQHLEEHILPFLIENSAELGIQRIHDYAEKRYWQAGKGWIMRPPGIGTGRWIHVETHIDSWHDGRTVEERTTASPPAPATPPKYPGKALKLGSTGTAVKRIQAVVGATQDGDFGPITERRVRDWQTEHHLDADGIVGKATWAAMFPQVNA